MKKLSLILLSLFCFPTCSSVAQPTHVSENISINEIVDNNAQTLAIMNFGLDILKNSDITKNVLISPSSIVSAIGMTANGAEEETLAQIENVLGTDIASLNEFLYHYKSSLLNTDKFELHMANSIWINEDPNINVLESFLKTNTKYYDSSIYKIPFNEQTHNLINQWVLDNTKERIENILSAPVPREAIMYLVNALSFDAEWQKIYEEFDIHQAEFTTLNNEKQTVDFMSSKETHYIELENGIGFKKLYADNKYSFVAILPNNNIMDFIENLDSEALINSLDEENNMVVYAQMPKFSADYKVNLKEILSSIGMQYAFNEVLADFDKLASVPENTNIFINDIAHQTTITVDEKGTEAGAATVVMMFTTAAVIFDFVEINLNKPFFYMIIDNEFNVPIFMGILNTVQ